MRMEQGLYKTEATLAMHLLFVTLEQALLLQQFHTNTKAKITAKSFTSPLLDMSKRLIGPRQDLGVLRLLSLKILLTRAALALQHAGATNFWMGYGCTMHHKMGKSSTGNPHFGQRSRLLSRTPGNYM